MVALASISETGFESVDYVLVVLVIAAIGHWIVRRRALPTGNTPAELQFAAPVPPAGARHTRPEPIPASEAIKIGR